MEDYLDKLGASAHAVRPTDRSIRSFLDVASEAWSILYDRVLLRPEAYHEVRDFEHALAPVEQTVLAAKTPRNDVYLERLRWYQDLARKLRENGPTAVNIAIEEKIFELEHDRS